MTAAKTLTIAEKNVAAGSCPFLYAWDGKGFRFVTDLLGNSPIGLPLSRDIMLTADPDEIVLIGDADLFPPRNGAYTVVVSDEFREILYLDQAKLVAVDHPSAIEVHPTDRLMPPPFPPSQVWALGSPARLLQALGDDGVAAISGWASHAWDPEFPPFTPEVDILKTKWNEFQQAIHEKDPAKPIFITEYACVNDPGNGICAVENTLQSARHAL